MAHITPGQNATGGVQMFCGDGSDGNVTIGAGTTTLTRDMQYNNLTVTGTLIPAGFRVFVAGTLTGSGTIQIDGQTNTGQGAPYNNYSSPYYDLGQKGQGGVGATGAGGAGVAHGFAQSLGAAGGAGGAGGTGAAGAAGSLNGITVATSGVALANVAALHPSQLFTGHGMNGTQITVAYTGGTGGGGGGGDGTNAGGGGGQGGGVVALFVNDASAFTGIISANGGGGGPGAAGNAGGGGGGGGGLAALFAAILPTGAYTIRANGGAGGTPTGTGVAGSAGSAGTTIAKVV